MFFLQKGKYLVHIFLFHVCVLLFLDMQPTKEQLEIYWPARDIFYLFIVN